ncbi:MAG: hypothetical protein IJW40_11230 [Clostridia bacterium]|nr:hypothetical protein [Clostridia bacterium]
MMKRLIALLLCLIMCVSVFAGCATDGTEEDDDKGAYITMYLTNEIYNFDPAYAFNNEEAESIVSLLFTRLFTLSEKGKLQYELAQSYTTAENEKTNEYTLTIKMRETWWSDKTRVTADDVVYAWKRLLDPENSFSAAALLYDIKNARAVKEGDCSIDDLGVYALNDTTLEIVFERPIDYDAFLLNLTSLALAPLREDYVSKGDDWAKKPGTMVTSGPFKIGKLYLNTEEDAKAKALSGYFTTYYDAHALSYDNGEYYPAENKNFYEGKYLSFALERNACYYRNPDEADDIKLDKQVTPYRIIVDCSYSPEQLKAAYQNGEVFYMGDIPVSLRSDSEFIADANIKDGLSTASIYLNQNAMITNKSTGEEVALFADANVRKALSLALDRETIAKTLVFAKAATGIVPVGIYDQGLSGSFREAVGNLIATTADTSAASSALSAAGVKASDYAFELTVNPNDDEMVVIATAAAEAWTALGFEVTVVERGTIINNDWYAPTETYPIDIADELYHEDVLNRDFQAIVLDFCAYNQDAYSMLAPFATLFSGIVDEEMNLVPGYTGYQSETYDKLVEAIYYLTYFDSITSANYTSFASYETAEEFQTILDNCSAVYSQYGISTSNVAAGRTALLHEAEKMLVDEMVIIPVVFNQTATLQSDLLSKITADYFVAYDFQKVKLKNYEDYIENLEQAYSFKTFYVCDSCGHMNEANALSTKEDDYLLTACSKCSAALTMDDILGQIPFYSRIKEAMAAASAD